MAIRATSQVDQDRLWQQACERRAEKIERAENILTGLKVTAAVGLGVPALYFGAVYGIPALAKAGLAAGGLAHIFAAGRSLLSPIKKLFWGNSWRTRIPWAITYGTSTVALWKAGQEKAAPFWKLEKGKLPYPNLQDPRYRQRTADYIRLARHLLNQPIKGHSMNILFDHARQSGNPEIQAVFSQLFPQELQQPGAFTTLYRRSENFCLNFTQAVQELPCRPGSLDFMGASRAPLVPVENNFPAPSWQGESFADFTQGASRFLINRRRFTPHEAVTLLIKKHGSPTLVKSILGKLHRNLNLPEGVATVHYMLLNLFMRSEAISSDAKLLYAGLLRASLAEYKEAMEAKIEGLRPAVALIAAEPQLDTQTGEFYLKSPVQNPAVLITFLDELRREKEALLKALSVFAEWGLQNWSKEYHAGLQKTLEEAKGEIEEIYGDFERIRYNVFYNGDYLTTAERDYWAALGAKKDGQIIQDGYMVRSRSVSDVWRSELSVEGALWGGLAGSIGLNVGFSAPAKEMFRAGSFWQRGVGYVPWIVAGVIVYPNISAVVSASEEPSPLSRKKLKER